MQKICGFQKLTKFSGSTNSSYFRMVEWFPYRQMITTTTNANKKHIGREQSHYRLHENIRETSHVQHTRNTKKSDLMNKKLQSKSDTTANKKFNRFTLHWHCALPSDHSFSSSMFPINENG